MCYVCVCATAAGAIYPGSPAMAIPQYVLDVVIDQSGSRYDYILLSGGEQYSSISLLTRSNVLSDTLKARFDSFIATTHFPFDVVSVVFQANCYYGWLQPLIPLTPGVKLPVPVSTFSASKVVGRWYQLKIDQDQLIYSMGFNDCASVDFEVRLFRRE
jgi:hypothetical protein